MRQDLTVMPRLVLNFWAWYPSDSDSRVAWTIVTLHCWLVIYSTQWSISLFKWRVWEGLSPCLRRFHALPCIFCLLVPAYNLSPAESQAVKPICQLYGFHHCAFQVSGLHLALSKTDCPLLTFPINSWTVVIKCLKFLIWLSLWVIKGGCLLVCLLLVLLFDGPISS